MLAGLYENISLRTKSCHFTVNTSGFYLNLQTNVLSPSCALHHSRSAPDHRKEILDKHSLFQGYGETPGVRQQTPEKVRTAVAKDLILKAVSAIF